MRLYRFVGFEACSAFTRVTAAVTVYRDTLTEGFSHFVTSIAAALLPAGAVAGWDLHPLERCRLFTAHQPRRDCVIEPSCVASMLDESL